MRKFKYIFVGIILIIIMIIIGLCYWYFKNTNNTAKENPEEDENFIEKVYYNIKTTDENPIKQDEIEVINIDMNEIPSANVLEVEATLKNNSNEDIKGFEVYLELLDEKEKRITVVGENSNNVIPANGTYTLKSNVTGNKDGKKIKTAKIFRFKKKEDKSKRSKKPLENMVELFDDMVEESTP